MIVTPDTFVSYLPARPYCTDNLDWGLKIRRRERAIELAYVQPNHMHTLQFLTFDVDRPGAAIDWRDNLCPAPNIAVENPENGHAHLIYLLGKPVYRSDAAREGPLRWAADIERGLRRRHAADAGYSGTIIKNPINARWRAFYFREEPYDLYGLDSWLDADDKRRPPRIGSEAGLGRNVAIFEAVRQHGYRHVLSIKRSPNGSQGALHAELIEAANIANSEFASPLLPREIAAIAKSVTRWTWKNFSIEKFSAIQSARGRRSGKSRGDPIKQRLAEIGDLKAVSAAELAAQLGCSLRYAKTLRARKAGEAVLVQIVQLVSDGTSEHPNKAANYALRKPRL